MVIWWQRASLLWWSLVSVCCEVYQEISILMLKRSVGNCISTTIWFFCSALFRAGLRQNECETGTERQSQNHHIWNRSPPQTHNAQYSRPGWQLKWQTWIKNWIRNLGVFPCHTQEVSSIAKRFSWHLYRVQWVTTSNSAPSALKCNYLHSPIPESIFIYLKLN